MMQPQWNRPQIKEQEKPEKEKDKKYNLIYHRELKNGYKDANSIKMDIEMIKKSLIQEGPVKGPET